VLLDAANGLSFLPDQSPDIVHGDLRGSNILIMLADEHFCVTLGSVTNSLEEIELTTRDMDWLRWWAPGIVGHGVETSGPVETVAADVRSLEMCFYEILTGNRPYPSESFFLRPAARDFCRLEPISG